MFDWRVVEQAEYSRQAEPSFVELTTRSYLTSSGVARAHTTDPLFLRRAAAVKQLAELISQGAATGLLIEGFKAYHPYPVQAVWQGDHFKIWLKQPLFIDRAVYEKAMMQADLTEPIDFEQLAEGSEIQAAVPGPLTADASVLAKLRQAVVAGGYHLLDEESHRELYLDGLPLTERKLVLVRLAFDPAGKRPSYAARN